MIGEHIDYVLFGCIPAAIEPDILIACGPSTSASTGTGGVHAHNLNPKYQPQNFVPMLKTGGPTAAEEAGAASTVHAEAAWQLDIDKRELRWESYVKAGYYVRMLIDTCHHNCGKSLLAPIARILISTTCYFILAQYTRTGFCPLALE